MDPLLLSPLLACPTHTAPRCPLDMAVSCAWESRGCDCASPLNQGSSDGPGLTHPGQASLSSHCRLLESTADSGIHLINPFITCPSVEPDGPQNGNQKASPCFSPHLLLCSAYLSPLLLCRSVPRAAFLWDIVRLTDFSAGKDWLLKVHLVQGLPFLSAPVHSPLEDLEMVSLDSSHSPQGVLYAFLPQRLWMGCLRC